MNADTGFNPLNAELNHICHLLALLEAHHILHVSRVRVNAYIVTAMDTNIRCHACGALGRSTTVCIKKGRNAWRMSSLGNRKVGTWPVVRGVQAGAMHPLGIVKHQR